MNKINKLLLLENIYDEAILDPEDNIILPNLKFMGESNSLYLSEDLFTMYFDNIIKSSFNINNNNICYFESIFKTDYFITIDFVNFMYKIPNILLTSLKKCKNNPNIRFYILPLRLNFNYKNAHSNIIIIDNYLMTIEHFEPHGESFLGLNLPYNIQNHIQTLINKLYPFRSRFYTFKNVQSSCPRGLQSKQNLANPSSGHCLAWSLLFIQTRINNLILTSDYIINYFNTRFTNEELDSYMKRFIGFLENTNIVTTKTIPNFKFSLHLSEKEIENISNRIEYLVKSYLVDSTNKYVNSKHINTIFEELVSYHHFPKFNYLFFKNVNWFYKQELLRDSTDSDSDSESDVFDNEIDELETKRKSISPIIDNDNKKSKYEDEASHEDEYSEDEDSEDEQLNILFKKYKYL